jgi:chemotaxis response regulator CheB
LPVVLLAPDTVEGARITMQALLDGASEYLVKRSRDGETRLTLSRARFFCGVRRLLGTHWAAEVTPCLGERGRRGERLIPDGSRGDGDGAPTGWLRLDAGPGRLVVRRPADPLAGAEGWTALAMATSRSLARLARALAPEPERPGGPVVTFTPQSRRFARGLREALSRRWNRPVLELRDGESPRAGQWRLAPGRVLLHVRGDHRPAAFGLAPNRLVDDGRSTVRQLRLLQAARPGQLRILLVERPAGAAQAQLLALARDGQAVYLHAEALRSPEPAGSGTWLEGLGDWAAEASRERILEGSG